MTAASPSTGTRVCPICDGPKALQAFVCRPCRGYLQRTAAHGTETRYKRCRCDDCRAAAREARARRRARDAG